MNIYPSLKEISRIASESYYSIPVGIEIPLDTLTPVGAFLQLKASGKIPSFLLESADGGEQVGRYSYIGLDPFAKLSINDHHFSFTSNSSNVQKDCQTPLDEIGSYFEKYKSMCHSNFPPFQGGAVGYVGFDCIRYLESVQLPEKKLHDAPEAILLFFHKIIAFDLLKHRLYLITHIDLSKDNIETEYQKADEYLSELRNLLFSNKPIEQLVHVPFNNSSYPPLEVTPSLGKELFCQGVEKVKEYVQNGDIFQCVLSDVFRFPLKEDPFTVYRLLRMINPSPYLYYFNSGEETLLGSSPEMLLKVDQGNIETCPIAGTRPRGSTEALDKQFEKELLANEKEIAEHIMLVDLGRNDLGRTSKAGSVRVENFMHIERFSHVMHIVSNVHGKLNPSYSPWDAFKACFPAGTLSGAPKIRAMEIISELEKVRRGPYGGAVVYYDFSGNLNSCITIRSLFVKNKTGFIQAGAGLVADSDPESEYEEVKNKSMAVKTAVSLTGLSTVEKQS